MSLYVIYYSKMVNITSMISKVMHISAIMKNFFSQYYKMVHYVVNNHLINKGISDDAGDTKWQCFEWHILAQSDSRWNFSHVLSMFWWPLYFLVSNLVISIDGIRELKNALNYPLNTLLYLCQITFNSRMVVLEKQISRITMKTWWNSGRLKQQNTSC